MNFSHITESVICLFVSFIINDNLSPIHILDMKIFWWMDVAIFVNLLDYTNLFWVDCKTSSSHNLYLSQCIALIHVPGY